MMFSKNAVYGGLIGLLCVTSAASAKEVDGFVPRPHPMPLPEPPVIRPVGLRDSEKPISVEMTETVVEENAYFKRVKAGFKFANPNGRTMQGEFEFPIPEGAFVCGYALEVNGEMVPGVVCEKEKARVAFENEVRKGVDPGLVEQVKGNVWKTRISPLNPNEPRKAEVEYVTPKANGESDQGKEAVYERDGDDWFRARGVDASDRSRPIRDVIAAFGKGTILWDASLSRLGKTEADRARLAGLPETGAWRLVVFSNVPDAPREFASRADLLKAVDEITYDGGTDLAAAVAATVRGEETLVFTDEIDTLGEKAFDLDSDRNLIPASRPDAAARPVVVEKLTAEEKAALTVEPKESTLLATVWAARRMQDLAGQSDARKDEFLALGRKYGVAGPGLSLIVLETLQQWLDHKIEPPDTLAIHNEWVRRRAAEDDPIAERRAQADHEARLLTYWAERVKWWNNPKPPAATPKSGLFENVARSRRSDAEIQASAAPMRNMDADVDAAVFDERLSARVAPRASSERRSYAAAPVAASSAPVAASSAPAPAKAAPGAAGSDRAVSVTLKAWDPKTPYIDALKAADKGAAYAVYLKQRETYKDSPAFYLDCAGWFFKADEPRIACRVISNLAEFKLENPALWRTMGWRLREAGSYDLAIRAFRKALALRGEEGCSYRDLALVLVERGKAKGDKGDLEAAARLFHEAAFKLHGRRATRRSNDFQVAIIALEELNGLLAWCEANKGTVGEVRTPAMDAAYRRDLPVKLRIVMGWDADETDIDLHVLEPNGEEAFYGHRRTAMGGFVSEDVTTGYGPEEYLKKDLESGVYRVLSNYYASHQTTLTGATTVQVSVYTDWGTAKEKMRILTLRLDKPKSKVTVGEIELTE